MFADIWNLNIGLENNYSLLYIIVFLGFMGRNYQNKGISSLFVSALLFLLVLSVRAKHNKAFLFRTEAAVCFIGLQT